jgi:Zn-dependent peptidase ImmA (M78 family)
MTLERWIDTLGVTVVERPCPQGWWGYYDPDRHEVTLRPSLGAVQRYSTLAHELGHAFYRHVGTTPKQERQASEWAARALIGPAEFESAAQVFDSVAAVANELNVLPRDVRRYARMRQDWRADAVSR